MIYNIPPICKKPLEVFNGSHPYLEYGKRSNTILVQGEYGDNKGIISSGFVNCNNYICVDGGECYSSGAPSSSMNFFLSESFNASRYSKITIATGSITNFYSYGTDSACWVCLFPSVDSWMHRTYIDRKAIPLFATDKIWLGESPQQLQEITFDIKDLKGEFYIGVFQSDEGGSSYSRQFNVYLGKIIAI